MTKIVPTQKSTTFIALFVLALSLFVALVPSSQIAQGAFFDDMINEDVVHFYEDEIAHEKFISTMSERQMNRLTSTYSVSQNRLWILLIIEDLGARVGNHKNLTELTKMTDNQLFSYGKGVIVSFVDTLTDEEKEVLKAGFKQALEG